MDISAYLNRIGLSAPPQPTAQGLAQVQRAHLYHVPFENLDIHLGRRVDLNPAALFEKIVTNRRGGFCYEVNSLLGELCAGLGCAVQLLSAEGANDDGSYSAPFDHLVLRVTTPDDPADAWLMDAGWGDGPLEPLRLAVGDEQPVNGRVYRIRSEADWLVMEEKLAGGGWLKHYRFDLTPHRLAEFGTMCQYHQTSPDSIFTQRRLCTRYLPDGRITLSEFKLIRTLMQGLRGAEDRSERLLSGETEALEVLNEQFGIKISQYPNR